MLKTLVLIPLILLPLASCSSEVTACGKREPYTGKTYGDAVTYLGDLERIYDSCSAK